MDLCISCLPFQHDLAIKPVPFWSTSARKPSLCNRLIKKKKSQPDHLLFKVHIQVLGDISVAEVSLFPESTPVSRTFHKENFEVILKAQIFLYSWMAFHQL